MWLFLNKSIINILFDFSWYMQFTVHDTHSLRRDAYLHCLNHIWEDGLLTPVWCCQVCSIKWTMTYICLAQVVALWPWPNYRPLHVFCHKVTVILRVTTYSPDEGAWIEVTEIPCIDLLSATTTMNEEFSAWSKFRIMHNKLHIRWLHHFHLSNDE